MTPFNTNLRKIREKAGLSRNDLAEKVGISVSALGQYEQGRREPDLQKLIAIATALHVSVDDLLGYHVDDFTKCKDFIESARIEDSYYSVSVKPDNSVFMQEFIGKELPLRFCIFESKDDFIQFIQKLKRGLTEMHEYRYALHMLVDSYMEKLDFFALMGRKINKEVVSKPLHELTTLIDSLFHQEKQRLSKILSDPQNEQAFKKNPESQRLLISRLGILDLLISQNKGVKPDLTPITAPDHDGTDDKQTKEKAATPKSDGKEND